MSRWTRPGLAGPDGRVRGAALLVYYHLVELSFQSTTIEFAALAGIVGLIAGALIVYASPRLAAYRFPDGVAQPDARVLVPLAGGWMAGWQPVRTLVLEVATAAALAGLVLHEGAHIQAVLGGVYSLVLITIGYIDLDFRLVLNRLSYPAIVVALAASLLWPGLGLKSALLGALVGLAVFVVLQVAGRGALGTGDTKLAVLIGAMRGLPGVFDALLIGMLFGGLAALFFLLVMKQGRKSFFAYAPYLAAGAVVSFFITGP